jgi:hypothetical protein
MPALHDFFGIPDRDMDDRVFVIADMLSYVEIRDNLPVVTFHGVVEWALDYLVTSEVIWLPTEEQLRMALVHRLEGERGNAFHLSSTDQGFKCEIQFRGNPLTFESSEAVEAYSAALLHVLRNP